jgi:hypothetical protein
MRWERAVRGVTCLGSDRQQRNDQGKTSTSLRHRNSTCKYLTARTLQRYAGAILVVRVGWKVTGELWMILEHSAS